MPLRTAINQSFDSRLIGLHVEESKQYSPMQTGTLFYKTSRLLYDGGESQARPNPIEILHIKRPKAVGLATTLFVSYGQAPWCGNGKIATCHNWLSAAGVGVFHTFVTLRRSFHGKLKVLGPWQYVTRLVEQRGCVLSAFLAPRHM